MAFGCSESNRKISEKSAVHFTNENIGTPVAIHFFNDEYHLFFCNDNDSVHVLGHLKSTNLLFWEETVPVGEFNADENFKAASIVRDWNNSSGLGNESGPLLTFFLNDNMVSYSISNDFGRSWKMSDENIDLGINLFFVNDLKVIWNEDAQKWIMLLLKDYQVEFYSSDNLINWEYQSVFEAEPAVKKGDWTAVEFFPLEMNETHEIKWCLSITTDTGAPNGGLGTQYFVGNFNEFQFETEDDVKWIDNGTDFSSAVILSDYLLLNKQPVCIGNINNGETDADEILSFPRIFSLIKKYNEYFICSLPIPELKQLENKAKLIAANEFSGELQINQKQNLPLEINLNFDLNNRKYLDFAEVYGVILENETHEKLIVGYHNLRRYFFISFQNENDAENAKVDYAPCIIDNSEVDIKLIIDESSVELFAMEGLVSMTKKYTAQSVLNRINLFTENGKITLKEGSITQLSGISN